MTILKGATRSKTVYLGLLVTILGFLQSQSMVFENLLTPQTWGLINVGIGVLIIVIRFLTVQSLEAKGAAPDVSATV